MFACRLTSHCELDFALNPPRFPPQSKLSATLLPWRPQSKSRPGHHLSRSRAAPPNRPRFRATSTLTQAPPRKPIRAAFQWRPQQRSFRPRLLLSFVGGSRANSTDWLLDGSDNNDVTAGGIGILSSIVRSRNSRYWTYNYSASSEPRGTHVLVTTKSDP